METSYDTLLLIRILRHSLTPSLPDLPRRQRSTPAPLPDGLLWASSPHLAWPSIHPPRGCEVFVVREGWEGLVRGNASDEDLEKPILPPSSVKSKKGAPFVPTYGDGELLREGEGEAGFKGRYIIRVGWDDVRGFVNEGGTLIGTARSAAFRELEGRRRAAFNLVKHGIDALVVCGGDGSLTGADRLRSEWPDHLQALLEEGEWMLALWRFSLPDGRRLRD